MKHSDIGNYYKDFLEVFNYTDNIDDLDISKNEISKSIYKQIFKIKAAQWKFKIMFKRRKNSSISDIFQDIVALYLSLALGNEYEIILEERIGKYNPDILIKHKGINLFIIEVKTSIGWEREMASNGKMFKRIDVLSQNANIPKENIVYILLSPWNVNRKFTSKYWDIENGIPKKLPSEFPFNKIRPLLTGEDPFYRKEYKDFKHIKFLEYSDSQIDSYAENGIVIPIELTIDEIKNAAKV